MPLDTDPLTELTSSSAPLDSLIAKHSERTGLDPELVRRLVRQESRGKSGAVSPKGAGGLMQLMPATAAQLGVKNRFDPDENVRAGTDYLKQQLDEFGDVNLALAAYNCFDSATEILTDQGWKLFAAMDGSERVASYSVIRDHVSFAPALAAQQFHYTGPMYSFEARGASALVTPNHRMIARSSGAQTVFRLTEASSITWTGGCVLKSAAKGHDIEYPLTDDQIRIAAWVITDGTINYSARSWRVYLYQRVSKAPLIKQVLDSLKWDYRVSIHDQKPTEICGRVLVRPSEPREHIRLSASSRDELFKFLPRKENLPEWLFSLSRRQFLVFLDAYVDGDGSRNLKSGARAAKSYRHVQITGKVGIIGQLQAAAVMNGCRASIYERSTDSNYQVLNVVIGRTDTKTPAPSIKNYDGKVYCVTTKDGTVVVRRCGCVIITGNSGPGAVRKHGNKVPPYAETQNYVKTIGQGYQGTGYAQDPLTELTKPQKVQPQTDPLSEITQPQTSTVIETGRGAGMARSRTQKPQVRKVPPRNLMRDLQSGISGVEPSMAGAGASRGKLSKADEVKEVARLSAPPGFSLLPEDAQNVITEQMAKGASGIAATTAGLVRNLPHDPLDQKPITAQAANTLNQASQTLGRGGQEMEREANRPTVKVPVVGNVGMQDVYNVGGGLISSAPALVLTRLGVPAPVAFGLDSYLKASGRDADWQDILKETGLGAATGALFEIPVSQKLNLLSRIGARLGIVGGGTYGLEKLAGMPEAEARKNAAVNALFAASSEKTIKPELAEAIPASKAREFAPVLSPSELAKRTALSRPPIRTTLDMPSSVVTDAPQSRDVEVAGTPTPSKRTNVSVPSENLSEQVGVGILPDTGNIASANAKIEALKRRIAETTQVKNPTSRTAALRKSLDTQLADAISVRNSLLDPKVQARLENRSLSDVLAERRAKNANQVETQPNVAAQSESTQPATTRIASSDQARMGRGIIQPSLSEALPENATEPGIVDERGGQSSVSAEAQPPRHVDLQPRRQRGDGKGQFKTETRAQREERLAKVNPVEAQPEPSVSTQIETPASPQEGAREGKPIEVWHGSSLGPESVARKFAGERVGKGLGFSATGYGIHFTDSPEAADVYRARVAGNRPVLADLNKRLASDLNISPELASTVGDALRDQGRTSGIVTLKYLLDHKSPQEIGYKNKSAAQEAIARASDYLQKKTDAEIYNEIRESGGVYKASLNLSSSELLQWSKPFAEQPPKVQSALQFVLGREIKPEERGVDLYLEASKTKSGIKQASEALSRAGIKGSQATNAGANEYVVFDPSRITHSPAPPIEEAKPSDRIKPKGVEQSAIPIQAANEMDVRQQAGNGKALGERNTVNKVPPKTESVDRPEINRARSEERSFPKTLEASGREKGTNLTYEVITNPESRAQAKSVVDSKGIDGAMDDLRASGGAQRTALGIELVDRATHEAKEFEAKGDTANAAQRYAQASEAASQAAANLTTAGQEVQAAQIATRYTPEGALVEGARIAKANNIPFRPEQVKATHDIASQIAESKQRISELERQVESLKSRKVPPKTIKPSKIENAKDYFARMESDARARLEARKAQILQEAVGTKSERGAAVNPVVVAQDIADWTTIGAAKIARGGLDFAQWQAEMVKDLGEQVRPYLEKIFVDAHNQVKERRSTLTEEAKLRSAGRRQQPNQTLQDALEELNAERARNRQAKRDLDRHFDELELSAKRGKMDAFLSLTRDSLLSLRGLGRILSGMTGKQVIDLAGKLPATASDIVLSKVAGTPRTTSMPSFGTLLRTVGGFTEGVPSAVKSAFKGEATEMMPEAYPQPKSESPFITYPTRIMQRLYGSKEAVIRSWAYPREIEERARTFAINDAREGIIKRSQIDQRAKDYVRGRVEFDGKENQRLAKSLAEQAAKYEVQSKQIIPSMESVRVKDMVQSPTELLHSLALQSADKAVYAQPSAVSKGIGAAKNAIGSISPEAKTPLDIAQTTVLPFVKRPANNIADSLFGYTGAKIPIEGYRLIKQAINKEVSPTQVKAFNDAVGKGSAGFAVMAVGAMLNKKGVLTSPLDKDHPASIKVGNKYYSVGYVPVVGWLLGMGAAYQQNGVKAVPVSMAKMVLEHPLLRSAKDISEGLTNIAQAKASGTNWLQSAESGASRYAGQTLSRIVPAPVKIASEGTDTKERDTRGLLGPLKASIPGVRETLPDAGDKSRTSIINPFYSRQTYKQAEWDKKSPAEKLARTQRRRSNDEDTRTDDEIEMDKRLSAIRDASRKEQGDKPRTRDALQKLVTSGDISIDKANRILNAGSNQLLEDVKAGGLEDALNVYDVATPKERQDIFPIIVQKRHLLYDMSGKDKAAAEARMEKLGIPTKGLIKIPPQPMVKKLRLNPQSRVSIAQ